MWHGFWLIPRLPSNLCRHLCLPIVPAFEARYVCEDLGASACVYHAVSFVYGAIPNFRIRWVPYLNSVPRAQSTASVRSFLAKPFASSFVAALYLTLHRKPYVSFNPSSLQGEHSHAPAARPSGVVHVQTIVSIERDFSLPTAFRIVRCSLGADDSNKLPAPCANTGR